ncbi:MAG: DUF4293 domain-containing protein [Bacteroidetes bacterium]|nr:DUF4293 domain-containing protein [Bacteroidota bacterium]
MIQRIQSVFLLLAAAASFSLFGFPFASTNQEVSASGIFNDALYSIEDHIVLTIVFCLAGGLAFISIFLFKKRKLQLSFSRISIIASVIGLVLGVILYMQDSNTLGEAVIKDEYGLFMPVFAIVFTLLAIRFINKDNKIVSSMDRLR